MKLSGHTSPQAIYATTVTFTALAFIAVLARLYTRLFIIRQHGLDDFFIILGCSFFIVMSAAIGKQTEYGMGRHLDELTAEQFMTALMWLWCSVWAYYAALAFIKLSILLQYLRLFPNPRFRVICWVLVGIISVWSVWAICSAVLMCTPIAYFWEHPSLNSKQCFDRLTVWYVNAGINISTDFIVALMPLPLLNTLKVPRKQKLLLMLVFSIGLSVCVVSVMRLAYIFPIARSADMTWESPVISVSSAVETSLGIMCSCAPTLKGLIQRVFPGILESLSGSRGAAAIDSEASRFSQQPTLEVSRESKGSKSSQNSDDDLLKQYMEARKNSKARRHNPFAQWGNATMMDSTSTYSAGTYTARPSHDHTIEVTRTVDQCSSHHPSNATSRRRSTQELTKVSSEIYDMEFEQIVNLGKH